jgi:5'-3' exonuclease
LGVINACRDPLDFEPVQRKHKVFSRLFRWVDLGKNLTRLIPLLYSSSSISPIEAKYLELGWLQDVLDRAYRIEREVDALSRLYEGKGGTSVQNIVIDGHNLAFRCLYAPGMETLSDTKGRPTGMLVGFLRSLTALKKRYPDAHICVCWDGSSQRRRQLFAGYKANRGERAGNGSFDQIAWLRETLAILGVEQAYNSEEEADDVIGALVRGIFKGQRNMILSTDRDFLQLVTRTDYQLVPSVGGKKEILYDVDAVVRDYGVPPERMVLLRAFLGDTSDNIPGVPRVPTKVLTNLVRLYSSVDKVYSSSLAGLTKSQYEKLREAEDQVRLNVRLMSLDTGTTFVLTKPDPNQNVAQERLQDVEIKAAPILAAFFDRVAGPEEQRVDNDERLRDPGRPG